MRVDRKSIYPKMCEVCVCNRKMIAGKILAYYKSFRKMSCPMMSEVEVCHRKMICVDMIFLLSMIR